MHKQVYPGGAFGSCETIREAVPYVRDKNKNENEFLTIPISFFQFGILTLRVLILTKTETLVEVVTNLRFPSKCQM